MIGFKGLLRIYMSVFSIDMRRLHEKGKKRGKLTATRTDDFVSHLS
jgi:hypothetical protein